jgi:hypothetical protein
MRKISALMFSCVLSITYLNAQTNTFPSTGAAGIGTLTPDASSLLDIVSTTKGVLVPRMTVAQRNAIVGPATGLMIYQTNNTPGFYYYSGSAWVAVSPKGVNKTLSNLTGPTAINADLLPNATNSLNLGSSGVGWKGLYLTGSIYSNGNRFMSNDATNTWVGLYSGLSNSGSYNTALGNSALAANTSGASNTAIGYSSLNGNSSGSYNIAIGQASMYSNTAGLGNIAAGFAALYANGTGSYNNAYGYNALLHNTAGYSNVAIGNAALYWNTTGHNLVAVGDSALYNQSTNVSGFYFNTALGSKALFSNTTGYNNTANGYLCLYYNTTGSLNTANGSYALFHNTTGYNNTANGYEALTDNTTGFANTGSGYHALTDNTTGNSNTANGIYALASNTTGNTNTANGANALIYNNTGFSNVAVGASALYSNSNKSNLVAVGDSALYNNGIGATTSGQAYRNTAVGSKSLFANTLGSENTANGFESLRDNTTGDDNSAYGKYALRSNTTGNDNTANGDGALIINTTGRNNTASGAAALQQNTTGSYNTAVGSFADVNGVFNNATAIGSSAIVDASNKVRVGDVNITSIGGKVGWTTFPSDGRYKKNIKEDVKGLVFINSLKPITYTVDIDALNTYYDKNRKHDDAYEKMKKEMQPAADEASKIVYNGFIAQDVEAAAKKLNYNFSGVDKPKTDDGLYGLRYSDFVVPLVKGMQELSEENNALKSEIQNLKSEMNELKAIVLAGSQSGVSMQRVTINEKPETAKLEQNIPNPFNHTTIINYTLPQQFSSAKIIVTDIAGKVLKEVNITNAGKGSLMLDASTLAAGAYQYSLYVDRRLIDTKPMEHIK